MPSVRSWWVLPVLMALFASCAPRPPVLTLDTRTVSAGELILTVRERSSRLHSLSGSGSLAFESPTVAGSASSRESTSMCDAARSWAWPDRTA